MSTAISSGAYFSCSTNATFPLKTVSKLLIINFFGSFWIFLVKIRNPIHFINELDSGCDLLVVSAHKPTFDILFSFLSKEKMIHVLFGNEYIYHVLLLYFSCCQFLCLRSNRVISRMALIGSWTYAHVCVHALLMNMIYAIFTLFTSELYIYSQISNY